MNWIQKIRYYNLMDRLVKSQKKTRDELVSENSMKDLLINTLRQTEKDSAEHRERMSKELAEVKKKYEKVCKENRHLEREIERLKLTRL